MEKQEKQKTTLERRRSPRSVLDPPVVGLLQPNGSISDPDSRFVLPNNLLFVDLVNRSSEGLGIITKEKPASREAFLVQFFDKLKKSWEAYRAEIKWQGADTARDGYYQIGVHLGSKLVNDHRFSDIAVSAKSKPTGEDYAFFRQTDLLKSIPREAVCPLLNSIAFKHVSCGQRFITQGSPGDRFYIIQHGSCVVNVERDGKLTPVARLQDGDIVGEMAILTGEPRSAHVDAESDLDLWELGRDQFDDLTAQFPALRTFLSELLTNWFETRTITARRKIGKYILTDIVGKGGYSIVFRGVHEVLGMPVAIKMMKHDMAMEPDFVSKFRDEARTIAGFHHENIVQVYDIEECFRTVFIVMEYLEGMSLRQLMQTMKRLPHVQVVSYLLQICCGLQYAHRQNIVHQDIKPGNILILPDDRIKILDFGLSCVCGSECLLTGTPFYMSPEQIECLPIDQRSDIYSLGLIGYEMLTGSRPYDEQNGWAVMELHVNEPVPDPAEIVPGLPSGLSEFILKACDRDPDLRYQNISEVIEALGPLTGEPESVDSALDQTDRKIATMVFLYRDAHKKLLNKEMAEFCSRVRAMGIDCKAASFQDI